jgi:hypothetical protein
MGFTTCNLRHMLVLKAHDLLRELDCVFFSLAQLLDQAQRQTELSTLGTAPYKHLTFLCDANSVKASTGHMLNFGVFEVFNLGWGLSVSYIILTSLRSSSPTENFLVLVDRN